jgi:restriction endonuclease Mrr
MAIPDYQSIMLPLLKFVGDEKEHSLRESIEALADEFDLSEQERKELLPSGQQAAFDNRVGWARTYMKKAGSADAAPHTADAVFAEVFCSMDLTPTIWPIASSTRPCSTPTAGLTT